MAPPTTFQFGPYNIDLDEKLLRRGPEPVALPPKAVETLLLLVRSAGQVVTKEEIMRSVWPDAFVEENNLTQQISILRKTLGDGNSYIQTVPKRGYRFVVPEPAAPTASESRPRYYRTMILAAAAVLLVAAAISGFIATRARPIHSIAVLPVQPLAPNDELSAVGLGISDAVVQRLSYSNTLDVLPMSSVRRFLGTRLDPLKIGRELQVDAVLAGTIQRDGNRFRVTLELVDIRQNRTRWSGKIEESASDVFRLQDIVAEATLRSLQSSTAPAAEKSAARTQIPAAHEAFLKGRYYWSRRVDQDVDRSIAEFEKAVAADPSYAAAWAGLASILNLRSLHFQTEPEKSFKRSRAAAGRALELDPDLAEAHAALGFISFYFDWNWDEGEKAFRRAIELDPHNGNYRQLLSNLLVATSRYDEAIAVIHEAIKADPASMMVRSVAARQYFLARRYDESLALLQQTLAIDSTFRPARTSLGITLTELGRFDEAERALRSAIPASNQTLMHLAYLTALRGDAGQARKQMAESHAGGRDGALLHYDAAAVLAALGDFDSAFTQLDLGIRKRYSGMVWLNVDPRMDRLRKDPRFAECIRRVGLPTRG